MRDSAPLTPPFPRFFEKIPDSVVAFFVCTLTVVVNVAFINDKSSHVGLGSLLVQLSCAPNRHHQPPAVGYQKEPVGPPDQHLRAQCAVTPRQHDRQDHDQHQEADPVEADHP